MSSSAETSVAYHDPTALFRLDPVESESSSKTRRKPVLIILNCPLVSLELLRLLWQTCELRICADGGANRLYDFLKAGNISGSLLPTHIHGDLDSLRDEVRSYYNSKGVLISKDPDQYSTDFGKALKLIRMNTPQHNSAEESSHLETSGTTGTNSTASSKPSTTTSAVDVITLGSISGRVDHGLGLLHEFGREHKASPDLRLWLVSEASVSFVLGPSKTHIIQVASPNDVLGRHVGVVPVFGQAVISTKNLEWDVQGWETDMLGNVSTCNRVLGETCEISVEGERMLFTIERSKYTDDS